MSQNEQRPTQADIKGKMERLKATFAADLAKRMARIDELYLQVLARPEDEAALDELQRACHTLAGTAPAMGFSAVGSAARNLETAFKTLAEATTGALEAFRPLMEELRGATIAHGGAITFAPVPHPDAEVGVADGPPVCTVERPTPGSGSGRLVVLVDDDDVFREHLALQVSCFGYRVVALPEVEGLEKVCDTDQVAAIIMDLAFPEGELAGAEAISKLRKACPEVPPVIFVSRYGDFRARLEATRAGAAAYLQKPVAVRELVDHLDRLTMIAPADPYRVLIVDDDPVAAGYHSLILRERGILTKEITEPAEAFRELASFKPDLILLDLHMPGCNGYELSRVLRQIPAHVSVPIVFLSTERDRTRQLDALLTGGDDFLTKPIDPDSLFSSVTARAARMRLLRSLMEKDGLTGLYNHSTTRDRLSSFVEMARRQKKPLTFAMLDLDHFKKVNDTYGHHVGDAVLMVLSRLLKQRIRRTDLVGRYGGEEFAVILHDTPVEVAARIMDEIRESFSHLAHDADGGEFTSTFSCGVAQFPDFTDEQGLVKAADQALYNAKAGGRNRVALARREG